MSESVFFKFQISFLALGIIIEKESSAGCLNLHLPAKCLFVLSVHKLALVRIYVHIFIEGLAILLTHCR